MIHASLGNVHAVNLKENGSVNLESQVCSLELSKQLKELGVKQESLFYYQNQPFNDGTNDIGICIKEIISANNGNSITNTYSMDEFDEPIYSAFTVAELGELLPKGIVVNDISYFYTQIPCRDAKWFSIFYRNEFMSLKFNKIDPIEADARAKMLVYILENKLMELPND